MEVILSNVYLNAYKMRLKDGEPKSQKQLDEINTIIEFLEKSKKIDIPIEIIKEYENGK